MTINSRLIKSAQLIAVLAFGWAGLPQALAIPITINNNSFELPTTLTSDGQGGSYITASSGTFFTDTGWHGTPAADNVALYRFVSGTYIDPIPDGVTVGIIYQPSGGRLWQMTGKTFEAGETYTLSAFLGDRAPATNFQPSFIELYAGSDNSVLANDTLLKSLSVPTTPGAGRWFEKSLTFGPGDAGYAALLAGHQGESLIVALYTSATAGETDWDNVNFSYIAVPEPASLVLLGVGGVLLLRPRRTA